MRLSVFSLVLLVSLGWLRPFPAVADDVPSAVDQHGVAHRLTASDGSLTVVDFAASWCSPCREALPRLEKWAKENPSWRVLVVSVDDREEGRDRLVESLSLELPVLWDEGYLFSQRLRPVGMPSTFVVDGEGKVLYQEVGSGLSKWHKLVAFLAEHEARQ